MIIIIEGPDGGGKTTLAHYLADKYYLHYHHEGPPPKDIDVVEHYCAVLDSFRGKGAVMDRLALGERIYGPLLRGKDRLGDMGWTVFQRVVSAVGALQVMCLPTFDNCLRAWQSGRVELVTKVKTFQLTYQEYQQRTHGHFIYDYENPGALKDLEFIANKMHVIPPLASGVVGSRTAKFLFVGHRGSNPQAKHDLAFCATVGSSEYLNRAIDLAGYREDEIALMNAYTQDSHRRPIPRVNTVIALGSEASSACRFANVECVPLRHPQYYLRFFYYHIDTFVNELKRIRTLHDHQGR